MKNVKKYIYLFLIFGTLFGLTRSLTSHVYAQAVKVATPSTINSILASVNPGDTIQLHAGNYSPIVLGRSGYTVTNYPSERPIFDGGSTNIQIEITGTSITLRGDILLTNSKWAGIRASTGSKDIIIDGIEVTKTQSHAIISSGNNVIIQNVYVHDAVLENSSFNSNSFGSCIKGEQGADGLIIQNNTVEHCYGEAIATTMTLNADVKHNTVRSSWAVGIYVDNSVNVTVHDNFITCADPAFWRNSNGGSPSIAFAAEVYSGWTARFSGVVIKNNVIIGCEGFSWWGGAATLNSKIINNTIYNAVGAGIYLEGGTGFEVSNNITKIAPNLAGATQSNNVVATATTFVTTPSVTDPTSVKLKANITGIDTGIRDDFGGNTRTLPLSVGAWEFNSTSVSKPGDVNDDGIVNVIDIGIVIDNYNLSPIPNSKADLNGDGIVNVIDIGIVIDNYGK